MIQVGLPGGVVLQRDVYFGVSFLAAAKVI